MAKIYAPNKQYDGVSASVSFAKGVGETENPTLIAWFNGHGYTVEESEQDPPQEPGKFDGWDADQLKAYAEEKGIDLGKATTVDSMVKKIQDAETKEA
jgi:hypothetical protein